MATLPKNVCWNLLGMITPLVLMLVTTPLYIKLLGDARFGVLAIIWLLLNYLLFMDLGFGRAVANQFARIPITEKKQRGAIFWTAITLVMGVAILLLAILLLLLSTVSNQLINGSALQTEIQQCIPWICVGLIGVLPSLVSIGALEGQQKFGVSNLLHIFSVGLYQALPLVVAWQITDPVKLLPTVVTVGGCVRFIMGIIHIVAVIKVGHITRIPMYQTATAKQLIGFGGPVALTSLLSPLLETIDRLVLGKLQGAAAVAYYTAGYQLIRAIRILPIALSKALFPKFSQQQNNEALAAESLQFLLLLLTPMLMVGIVFIEPFLGWWLNETYQQKAGPVARILLLGVWFNGLAVLPYSQLQGQGRPGLVAKIHMAELLPYLLALGILVQQFGAIGAAIAWLLRMAVDYAALTFAVCRLNRNNTQVQGVTMTIIISAGLISMLYLATELLSFITVWQCFSLVAVAVAGWFGLAYFRMPIIKVAVNKIKRAYWPLARNR